MKTAILLGLAIVAMVALGVFQMFRGRAEKLEHVFAEKPRFAQQAEPFEAQTDFERRRMPDVYYHVVLRDVPLGWRLDLHCDWVDPTGAIARRNTYQTRIVYRSTWATHCHQRFTEASASGSWHVRLTMNGRVLSDAPFALK